MHPELHPVEQAQAGREAQQVAVVGAEHQAAIVEQMARVRLVAREGRVGRRGQLADAMRVAEIEAVVARQQQAVAARGDAQQRPLREHLRTRHRHQASVFEAGEAHALYPRVQGLLYRVEQARLGHQRPLPRAAVAAEEEQGPVGTEIEPARRFQQAPDRFHVGRRAFELEARSQVLEAQAAVGLGLEHSEQVVAANVDAAIPGAQQGTRPAPPGQGDQLPLAAGEAQHAFAIADVDHAALVRDDRRVPGRGRDLGRGVALQQRQAASGHRRRRRAQDGEQEQGDEEGGARHAASVPQQARLDASLRVRPLTLHVAIACKLRRLWQSRRL